VSNTLVIQEKKSISEYCKQISAFFAIGLGAAIPITTTVMEICFWGAVIFAILAGNWREKYLIIRNNRIAFMFVLMFLVFLLGVSYTQVPKLEAFDVVGKYFRLLLAISLFAVFADEKVRRYAFNSFLISVTVVLILSYIKTFTGNHLTFNDHEGQTGVFRDYIFTGLMFAFAAYCYGLLSFERPKWRWLFGILFILAVYNVFFINIGRTNYFVLMALLCLLAWQKFHWRGILGAFLISLALFSGASLFSANFKERLAMAHSDVRQYHKGNEDTSIGLRMNFYKYTFQLIYQHPFVGGGTGSFGQRYAALMGPNIPKSDDPHNDYLNVTVQLGMMGLAVLLLLYYFNWRESFRLPQERQYLAQAILITFLIGGLFNTWVRGLLELAFYIFFMTLVFGGLGIENQTETKST